MASPPPLSLDGTLGEVQIALVLATWLFGIETLQTWNYYRDFPTDGKALKGLVAVIWFLELGHTIACWHSMYLVTVTFYGRPEHILSPPLSMVFVILLHAFIAIGVQTFFVYRVWVLSGKWPIPILCCFLNLLRLGCNVLLFVDLSKHRLYSRLTTDLRWEVILMDTINPAVDIIIAASLVYYLWGRRKSDFKQTNRMVDTIIVWTLERTLLTTATGIMQLVLYLARDDLSWLIFFLIQGKRMYPSEIDPHADEIHSVLKFNACIAEWENALPFCS
ncbi:Saposin B-type domain-containing protein [Mycena venus]|uniref:Saposin B-type domain-containing protein n=1 Tax=Mycena venus TaxID=2733690 RepID=A0A8H7D2F2_9AGAR|nr:Saposin B-type domain-containing protein [Mycena venus]